MPVLKHYAVEASPDSLASRLGGAVSLSLRDMRAEGERMLAEARAESEKLVREARAEAARLRAKAVEEGKAEGFEKGRNEGLAQGRAEGDAAAREETRVTFAERMSKLDVAWTEALAQWETSREALMREARRNTIRLALGIASRIVRRTVQADRDVAVAQLEGALELLGKVTAVVVQCSKDDRELLGDSLPTVIERLGQTVDVTFIVDDTLGIGDVVVRVAEGGIDATLSTQLDRLADALLPGGGGARGDIP
ncbi:MAG: hypothetical protein JNM94_02085 [Phycisphaerae bacterium]|nr:hypothetical protein [Phycisphaerae bacterium]